MLKQLSNLCLSVIIFGSCAIACADDFAEVPEIKGYQEWSFTKGPFRVSPGMEELCVHQPFVGHPGTLKESSLYELKDTHIRVFANPSASKKIRGNSAQPFEVGSIILKEKLSSRLADKPESLGVMIKREAGFDPKYGDWEFIFLASGRRIARGPKVLADCYSCHQRQSFGDASTSDFVFIDLYN